MSAWFSGLSQGLPRLLGKGLGVVWGVWVEGRKWGKEREREEGGRKREDFVLIILFEPFSFSPSVGQMRPLAWGHCCSFWPRRTQEKMIL